MVKKTQHKTNNSKEKKNIKLKTEKYKQNVSTQEFQLFIDQLWCALNQLSVTASPIPQVFCVFSLLIIFFVRCGNLISHAFFQLFFFFSYVFLLLFLVYKGIKHSLTCPTSPHSMCSYRIRYFSCCWHIIFGFCLLHCVCT